MIKIGPYQVSALETGEFGLDGGAMFGVVPKVIWEKTNPADESNRIEMRLRCMLLQSKDRNILVDCGIGRNWSEKHEMIYKIDHSVYSLTKALEEKSLKPEDITDVVLSHLHFDHAGGLVKREDPTREDSRLIPTFPNAKVYLQKSQWEHAFLPSQKDKGSYVTENYAIYRDDPKWKEKLVLLETPGTDPSGRTLFREPELNLEEILPQVYVQVSHGHTVGMQLVKVSDGKTSILYCADLIPTVTHLRIPFVMGYDCYPVYIVEEKMKILEEAFQNKTLIFFDHCPKHKAVSLQKNEKGHYTVNQSIDL